jgi:hypothetical protein
VQVRYTELVRVPRVANDKLVVPDRLAIVFGLRFVFGSGITRRWPVRERRAQE